MATDPTFEQRPGPARRATVTMKINLNLTESGHVGLNVTDLERSDRFYRKIFGFGVQLESSDHGGKYAFLTNGGRLILTLWEQSEGRFKKYRPGLHHLAFHVASWDDLRRSKKVLDRLGVHYRYDRTTSEADGFMSSGIFFEDPDGISLEICSTRVNQAGSRIDNNACSS
jgi:lactoylglutathione lyase